MDVLWLAMDEHNHGWLVVGRGWAVEDFERWCVGTVGGAIL